jgi:hypothetical protein
MGVEDLQAAGQQQQDPGSDQDVGQSRDSARYRGLASAGL